MALILVTSLFALTLLWVSWRYLRRRDPLLRDVMWMFASVAMLFVIGLIRVSVGAPPRAVMIFALALLLAKPLFTLRVVGRIRPLRSWWWPVAATAWVLTTVPVVASATRPLPRPAVWPAAFAFFVVEAAAGWLLATEARRRGGAARARLWFAATGTGLLATALLLSATGRVMEPRLLALISGLAYLVAFVPPRGLRRAWSEGATHEPMRRLLGVPANESSRTWRSYCEDASAVLGADAVIVLMPSSDGSVRVVGCAARSANLAECTPTGLDEVLAADDPIDALAGWTHPPALAVAFAQASDTRFVTARPVDAPGGRGALLLLNRYRSLFAEDDMQAFTELVGHAAALAGRSQTLAERENLAAIVESSHDAIIGKTIDGEITSWNAGAEQLYGYPREEVLGRHASILFPAGQEDAEAQLIQRITGGENVDQSRVTRRRKDGTLIDVSLTLSPIVDVAGQITGVASISRDISERRRAEAMFEGLLEAAPDAIIGVTRDGAITLINAQAEQLFGYSRAELLGQPVDVLVPERLRGTHVHRRDGYFNHPRKRPMGAGAALTAVRKDGTEFPAEISLSSVNTDQGMIATTAIRDVTGRLIAQAERERLITQAERDASERRLQHARRLESLGELAGGVAHDFNNILAVISNYTEMVLDDPLLEPAAFAEIRSDLGQVGRAAERAARLTKQLLAFGRRDITQATVLNLNHVIGDVEQMLRRSLGEHIHLITNLDRHLWPIHADASQLEQILLNLAVNARDAMPGGGTLSIDTTNAEIADDDSAGRRLPPGRYVRLRVSDTGSGMPPEVIERAFEPFYTTKPKGSGTGLGLATVYGIATAAGGDVHLYSEAAIGTTVTIILPAVETPADSHSAPAVVPAAEMSTETPSHQTILMAEDEDDLRQITARVLTRAGYQVLTATGGAEAIHLAQTHPGPIHLLLTDVIMPKMMGNEVAAHVQQRRPGIPVLYMSGYAEPVLTENGTLPDGVTIVEKPFTSRELLDRVRTVLHSTTGTPSDLPQAPHPASKQRSPAIDITRRRLDPRPE
jgi:PAS domain S-box-containing protein